GRIGAIEIELRAEKGRRGLQMIGELRWPDLGLGLDLDTADGRPVLSLRDRRQGEQLTLAAGDALAACRPIDADDRGLRCERHAGPTQTESIVAFAVTLASLASQLEQGLASLLPPDALAGELSAWQEAARRLGGRLEVGRMAILGERERIHFVMRPCW